MKSFQIAFHVQEENEAAAQSWLERVRKILKAYEPELVSPTTKAGTFCEGHVIGESSDPRPKKVVEMGPRG